MRFSQEVGRGAADGLDLPGEIVSALDWLEDAGAVEHFNALSRKTDARYATLYPKAANVEEAAQSLVTFQAFEDFYYEYANASVAEVRSRIFFFARTGGDGSHAGLWRDDNGAQQFVHVGSGSGSIWGGVITDNAVDFLRFLAIGYPEPAFDETHNRTVEEAWLENMGYASIDEAMEEGEVPPVPPSDFQSFLSTAFSVSVPSRASEIVKQPVPDFDNLRGDPFAHWLRHISG